MDIVIELSVVIGMTSLECECRSDRIGGTLELGQQRITPQFSYATLVLADGLAEALKGILDTFVSQLLILLY